MIIPSSFSLFVCLIFLHTENVLFLSNLFPLYNSFLKQKFMNHTVIIVLYSIKSSYDDLQ